MRLLRHALVETRIPTQKLDSSQHLACTPLRVRVYQAKLLVMRMSQTPSSSIKALMKDSMQAQWITTKLPTSITLKHSKKRQSTKKAWPYSKTI